MARQEALFGVIMFVLKFFSFLFICFFAAFTDSCRLFTKSPKQPELTLKMFRTDCVKDCPVYSLVIQSDGDVVFEGVRNTKTRGTIEDKLSEEKIKELLNEIGKADFFSLTDSYTEESNNCSIYKTDYPITLILINLNGRKKYIKNDLGCWNKEGVFPQKLYNLENKIDEIVETKRWIGERK